MAYSWLPTVTSCCFCVNNLRTATILIAIYSMVGCPIAIYISLSFICSNQFDGIMGTFALLFVNLFFIVTIVYFFVSLALLIFALLDIPKGDTYVITTIVFIVFSIIKAILIWINMELLDFECGLAGPWKMVPEEAYAVDFVTTLVECSIYLYLAIVVNSYND